MAGSHSAQGPTEGIHAIQNWDPADATARTALTVVAADVGKIARQVDTGSFYVLQSVSPAVWVEITGGGGGGGPVTVSYTTSPSTGDYYNAASGICAGAADFIIACWYRHPGPSEPSGFKDIIRNDGFSGGSNGWSIIWNFGSLSWESWDGSNVSISGSPTDYYASNGYETGRDILLVLRVYQSGGVINADFWMNDRLVDTVVGSNTGMSVSTDTMRLLSAGEGEMMEGVAYYAGTLTDAQLSTWIVDCLEAGNTVALPSETNRWSAGDNAPGGASWVASTGGSNLTETGTTGTQTRNIRVA